MIRKLIISAVVALGVISAPASANGYYLEPSELQDCFDSLSTWQLKVWSTIGDGTLNVCRAYEKFLIDDYDPDGFEAELYKIKYRVYNSIGKISYEANEFFYKNSCPYGEVEFDTEGFEPYDAPFFTYAFLCGLEGNFEQCEGEQACEIDFGD